MIYDVSWPITPEMTRWPRTPAPRREMLYSISPSHFLPDGATVDQLGLEPFLGPCWLADLASLRLPSVSAVGLDAVVPIGTKRLLLRTTNSEVSPKEPFRDDYVALTEDAADWLVENQILCVGIDALSIERPDDESHAVHRRLLGAGVAIIEGLRLAHVPSGAYELICLPLALVKSDGAPARAVLVSSQPKRD